MTPADYAKPSMYAIAQKRKKRIRALAVFAAVLCLPVIGADLMSRWSHGAQQQTNSPLFRFHALAPNLDDTLNKQVRFAYDDDASPEPLKHVYLQVGSFIKIKNTKQVEQLLVAYNKDLHFEPLNKEHPNLLRVLLGPYGSATAAKPIQTALKQQHLSTLLVGR